MKRIMSLCAICLLAACAGLGCEPVNRLLCDEVADPCAYPGEVMCSADGLGVLSCLGNADGCLVWTQTATCDAGAPCAEAGGQAGCGCSDACPAAGASACDGTVILACAAGADGCLDWVAGQDCADSQQFCDATADPVVCSETCTDECQQAGASWCEGSAIMACSLGADGCLDLSTVRDCADDGLFCDPSTRPPSCSNSCTDRCPELGLSACDGTAIVLCQTGADGCLDWVVERDCADDGLFCDSTSRPVACSETCTDDCQNEGQERCLDTLIQVCGAGQDGCLDWLTQQDCAAEDPNATCGHAPTGLVCVGSCVSDDDCAAGQFCNLATCDAPRGACLDKPGGCTDEWNPVCGCDGLTYGNPCEAAAAGVSVDYPGMCEVAACFTDAMCAADEYCMFASCLQQQGVCAPRPVDCGEIYDPVCSCDGVTYDNACLAAAAGASVAYPGVCQSEYCWDNAMCAQTDYCFFQVCALETGYCLPRPTQCPDLWAPVCGCDGNTYSNACEAAAAGVSVDFEGECDSAYCWSNDMCGLGQYCFFADCGLETGVCEARPQGCPGVYDPVCGCDGLTYGNACEAAAAGMSVDYAGACEARTCTNANQCGQGSYCKFASCDASEGLCAPMPSGCPDIWDPVCGCDGRTYGNACEAAAVGVSLDYLGACETAVCGSNGDCGQTAYCLFETCDAQAGLCTDRPMDCPYLWDPVCGCDGLTYANACLAGQVGVSVDYPGECQTSACTSNEDCTSIGNTPQYCQLISCDSTGGGVCLPVPLSCPDIWDPVCGCDGFTYGNACEAAMAMVSVAYRGECQ